MKVVCTVSVGRLRMCFPFIQEFVLQNSPKYNISAISRLLPIFLKVLRFFDRML